MQKRRRIQTLSLKTIKQLDEQRKKHLQKEGARLPGLRPKCSQRSRLLVFMDEHQNPQEATKGGQDHLRAAAGDLKEAARAKVENTRQAVEQKADELRGAAQGKAQELRGAAESAWSDARSKGEAYVRDNPTKAVLIALGLGLLLE